MTTVREIFEEIQQPYQAYALVGLYLQQFALMEFSLGRLMAALLKLDTTQAQIITANMEFSAKAHTCRGLFKIAFPNEKDADKLLADLVNKHAARRNVMAHSVFFAAQANHGLELHKVRAKGELKRETENASAVDIIREAGLLVGVGEYLDTLAEKATEQRDLLERIARAPGLGQWTPHGTFGKGVFE